MGLADWTAGLFLHHHAIFENSPLSHPPLERQFHPSRTTGWVMCPSADALADECGRPYYTAFSF